MHVYERAGRYFVQPSNRTRWKEAGFWVFSGLVTALETSATDEKLGMAVLDALSASRVEVPVPPRDAKLEAGLFRAMGVRSRRAAMSGTRACLVMRNPPTGTLRIEPQRNGGSSGEARGYAPMPKLAVERPAESSASDVGGAVRAALLDAIAAT